MAHATVRSQGSSAEAGPKLGKASAQPLAGTLVSGGGRAQDERGVRGHIGGAGESGSAGWHARDLPPHRSLTCGRPLTPPASDRARDTGVVPNVGVIAD